MKKTIDITNKDIKKNESTVLLPAYSLEFTEELADIKSKGFIYRHKKSGARICVISNEDDNKVFNIGFKTPPSDDTGVPHIIEHTVLLGSKNFPVKDPFNELAKGSLNTFLNAMTYPDKTIYPVASCNDKDFQNLMHVYLDAVLYPNIYLKEEIFMQEGWHYELENADAQLKLNGIVYSEMKGAYSSPEQQLERGITKHLFPDTTYGKESGGDPESIPDLTYDAFLDFHRKFYHPSNSYIYLYGDMDVEEKLKFIDEQYLSHFEYQSIDSSIDLQEEFGKAKEVTDYYSISANEEEKNNTYLTCNMVAGSVLDVEECMALQIIETVLLSAPGAPLKQALIDAGIGQDIMGSFDDYTLQPYFTIIAKNANPSDLKRFKSVMKETLTSITKDGLNQNSLRAAINSQEFKYKEADFGSFPKGLLYGIQILSSWLHDDTKAFAYLHGNQYFDILKSKIGTGYYEELIKKYLLNSKHKLFYILKPKKGLNLVKEEELAKKLQDYKASLRKEEITALVELGQNLEQYQEEPDSKEAQESIPVLTRADIKKEAPHYYNKAKSVDDIPVIHHDIFTNKIAYVKLLFDVQGIDEETAPYLSFLMNVLGYIDTKEHSFMELSNEINIHTGGINTNLTTFSRKYDPDYYRPMAIISSKLLYTEFKTMFSLCKEIIKNSKLNDTKRLYDIAAETKSRLQMKMNSSGHIISSNRAISYYSQNAYFNELTEGIRYYKFIEQLCSDFDNRKQSLVKKLKELTELIFRKEVMTISITCDEEGYQEFERNLDPFVKAVTKKEVLKELPEVSYPIQKLNEGFLYSGQVQYVSRAGNYIKAGFKSSGSIKVLRSILEGDYLYNNIRVKGGAYGGMCSFSTMTGDVFFTSYRDPNLRETDEIYVKTYEYVKNFKVDERDMTKYIIGTMSTVDRPMTASQKGSRSLAAYFAGYTEEDVQKERDEILSVEMKDIRALSKLIKAVTDAGNFCVIGNEKKLEENKEMFMEIKSLL